MNNADHTIPAFVHELQHAANVALETGVTDPADPEFDLVVLQREAGSLAEIIVAWAKSDGLADDPEIFVEASVRLALFLVAINQGISASPTAKAVGQ